jgi:hypothetical protein
MGKVYKANELLKAADLNQSLAEKAEVGHTHAETPHNHDAEYQPKGLYADQVHEHPTLYAELNHAHPHDHFGEYAGKLEFDEHNHDGEYLTDPYDDTALTARVAQNETDIADLEARLTVVEDNVEPSTQTVLNTDVTVYADGAAATFDPLGSGGWYYQNAGGGEKVNWYFFGQGGGALTELVTLADLNSVYGLFRPRSDTTRIPFAALYTAPQGDGNDAATWYRSRIVWEILPNQAGIPNTGGTDFAWPVIAPGVHEPFLAWAGNTDPDVFTNVTHYQMQEQGFVTVGPKDPSEVVMFLVIGSDSSEGAGGYNFVLNTTGADLAEGGYQSTLIAIPGVDVP